MRADWIEIHEAKIQYRGFVNSAMYIRVPSTVGNFFKGFVKRILLHVAGYFDIFFTYSKTQAYEKSANGSKSGLHLRLSPSDLPGILLVELCGVIKPVCDKCTNI